MIVISRSGMVLIIIAAIALIGGFVAGAQEKKDKSHADPEGYIITTPANLQWEEGPTSLPSGAEYAIIEGDPKGPGPFTMRLKLPADYQIPARSHPVDEHITIISGSLHMGFGDHLNLANGKKLPAGSFVLIPAESNYFTWTSEETIVQLHGMGPWGIIYVNPEDDPREDQPAY